jgi:hypothetical protein
MKKNNISKVQYNEWAMFVLAQWRREMDVAEEGENAKVIITAAQLVSLRNRIENIFENNSEETFLPWAINFSIFRILHRYIHTHPDAIISHFDRIVTRSVLMREFERFTNFTIS